MVAFEYMSKSYQALPAAVAFVVAVYTSYLLVEIVRRAREAEREIAFGWRIGGALCIGTGLWAEHFIGLLSLELPIPLGYNANLTLLSWLPAVVVMGVVIAMLSRRHAPLPLRLLSVLLISAALSLTHYLGISSLDMHPGIVWDWSGVGLSAAVAVMAGGLGSVMLRRLLDAPQAPSLLAKLAVALALGGLLRAVQHIALSAAQFPMLSASMTADQLSGGALVNLVAVATLLLFVVAQMTSALEVRMRQQQERLASTLEQANTELESTAFRDALTRLPNRLGFERRLEDTVQRLGEQARLAVMMVNLDGFKVVNDSLGPAQGDTLLREVAARLQTLVRHDDLVARAASDEFLLLCGGPIEAHAATLVAQRIGEALSRPYELDGHEVSLSCSTGVALLPEHGPAQSLIANCSAAMRTAKQAGGGMHCFYEVGMGEGDSSAQIDLQRDLRHALAENQLMLYYQPKRHARTGHVRGVEALLRWKHPVRGMVSPGEFIPVAERFGLIGALGDWVIAEACRQVRVWQDQGLRVRVSINLSVHQLRQADLEQRIRDALAQHRIDPHLLICEITESVAMENTQASLRIFEQLAAIGVGISIDDFGTGYSSLSYLRRLPATELKIDRSFVQDLDKSRDARAIVEAVVRLAHALDLKVVAEGVETRAQQDILHELGCDELQGFLFARPMPAEDVMKRAAESRREPAAGEPAPELFFEVSGFGRA